MEDLGNSIECLKNDGAKLGFWLTIVIIAVFIGCSIFLEIDDLGKSMLVFVLLVFTCLAVYMFYRSKTEVHLRESGLYIRTLGKKHKVLYDEIAYFDKTKRIGKSGSIVFRFYLLVLEKKNGERIVFPFEVSNDFFEKLMEVSHADFK